MEDTVTKKNRQFWDGYLDANGKGGEVPNLELYIVDLHATLEKAIPKDLDSIDDRARYINS